MKDLQVKYTVIARTRKNQTLRARGRTGLTLQEPGDIVDALDILLLSALDGFVSDELEGEEVVVELLKLSRLTVRLEDIEVE